MGIQGIIYFSLSSFEPFAKVMSYNYIFTIIWILNCHLKCFDCEAVLQRKTILYIEDYLQCDMQCSTHKSNRISKPPEINSKIMKAK